MTAPRDTMPCPECGGLLDIVEDGAIGEEVIQNGCQVADRPLPFRIRPAVFAACNACEFLIEVRR